MSRVYYINESLSHFLQADVKHELNIINLGVTALQRNTAKGMSAGVECIFRINQDGAGWCLPHMEKRVIRSKNFSEFKRILISKYHDIDNCEDAELRQHMNDMTVGCFLIVFELENGNIEPVVMHRFVKNMSCMIAKENLFSLQMRYLSPAEQELCGTIDLFQTKKQ
jgi:hypothetical protein